jgi:hypothetical protein
LAIETGALSALLISSLAIGSEPCRSSGTSSHVFTDLPDMFPGLQWNLPGSFSPGFFSVEFLSSAMMERSAV